jgi:probable rRNA maturation factor
MDPSHSTGPAQAGIAITVVDTAWRRAARHAERVVRRAARAAGSGAQDGGVSVVLASDRTVRRLNAAHRGRNKPTNVLTYDSPAVGLPGEIVLARETVAREAAAAKRPVAHHLAHLVVHGVLHLRGHDHERAGDARRMEMAETRLLHRLRVPNPWRRA